MRDHKTLRATHDIIDAAIALFERESVGLCRFVLATDAKGRVVDPQDETAENFCAMGGLMHVSGVTAAYIEAVCAVERTCGERISIWTDRSNRSKAELVEALKTTRGFIEADIKRGEADSRSEALDANRCSGVAKPAGPSVADQIAALKAKTFAPSSNQS